MTTAEQKRNYDPKTGTYWPTLEGLRRSMWKLMPLIDERIKEGRLD